MIAGRRCGKSVAGIHDILKDAWDRGGLWQIIAPEWKHCKITVRKFQDIVRPIHDMIVHREHFSVPPYTVELTNGAEIVWASGDDPNTIRGEGPHGYLLDEFRSMKEEMIWDTIRPACMDHKAKVSIITTPFGVNNYTYAIWRRGMDRAHYPEYQSWGYLAHQPDKEGIVSQYDRGIPSYENPHLQQDPRSLREEMSQLAFEREILAIFHPDMDTAIRVNHSVWNSCKWLDGPVGPEPYFIGFDVGKHVDYSVLTVMNSDCQLVHMYRTQMDYANLKEYAINIFRHWNSALVLMDATGVGDPLFDSILTDYNNIQPYKISDNALKTALVTTLQLGFDHSKLSFPDPFEHRDSVGVLKDELGTFTFKTTPSGVTQYMARDGYHDDCVMSLALCYYLIRSGYGIVGLKDIWKDGYERFL